MSKPIRAPVFAPNSKFECKTDEELVRGFLLALGAGGRKQSTLQF